MAPRGRGFRPRGRGATRGRGRYTQERGTSRFGPTRKFESDRLADRTDSDGSEEESADAKSEIEDEFAGLDSEDDEIENAIAQPYLTLLQSLSNASAPKAKKRKLEHKGSPNNAKDVLQREEQVEEQQSADIVDPEDEEEPSTYEIEEATGGETDSDDDDGKDAATDGFLAHFERPNEESTSKAIQAVRDACWTTTRTSAQTLRAVLSSPGSGSSFQLPLPQKDLHALHIKQKLKEPAEAKIGKLNDYQASLMPILSSYRDVLYCNRTVADSERLRQIVCLHALNHVYKTRDRVIKNSYRLSKEGEEADLELRDQGFTRPKVLFLIPTRNSCARMINVIRDLCAPEQQENRKRFDDSFIDKEAKVADARPEDFKDLFEGNDDDMFRLGVKLTRKTIKYFAQFYSSDMLFASPLGLRMSMGLDKDKKKPDHDFLSSIEMVIVDQADALLMQNWEHVEYIFEHLNQQPKDAHGCDFSRVRNWYLEDWAKFFRQTIILSTFNTPELAELQRLHCHNWAGKIRLQPEYQGVIQQLGIRAKQTFSRLEAPSLDRDAESRFEYFQSTILRALVKRPKDATGTLLFIPSYLDFVSIRNFFATSPTVSNLAFGAISEYTDVPEASRARSYFLTGRYHVLLYTERAHHFRRYRFRGVRKVVFYSLPDNPTFYKEIAGESLAKSEQDLKIEPGQGLVRALFSRYDAMKLERVVGTKRVGKMLQERGDTFEFM